MKIIFFITLAAIVCISNTTRIKTEGIFDRIIKAGVATTAISGDQDAVRIAKDIGGAATQMNYGNYGVGVGNLAGVVADNTGQAKLANQFRTAGQLTT